MSSENPPPWRLSSDRPISLHFALFVRDALNLRVSREPDYPPRLMGEIPDLSGLFDKSMLAGATFHWARWWEETLEASTVVALSLQQGESKDAFRAIATTRQWFMDAVIADARDTDAGDAYQRLKTLMAEASNWFYGTDHATEVMRQNLPGIDGPLVSEIATEALRTYGQQGNTVAVGIFQLDVEGTWAKYYDSGLLIASKNFLMNDLLIRPALEELFRIGINNSGGFPLSLFSPFDPPGLMPKWISKETPLDIGAVGPAKLVLKTVQCHKVDCLELRLGIVGETVPREIRNLMASSRPTISGSLTARTPDVYDGLELEIVFPDGRSTGTLVAPRFTKGSREVTANRFRRHPNSPLEVWLIVLPIPPAGLITLNASWPQYGIVNASISFSFPASL